jgi:hypothetical protein
MSDIIIGVVGRDIVNEHTRYAPDALAIHVAANAAHHMMNSVFPDRLSQVNRICPRGTLPIRVDSVSYVGLNKKLSFTNGATYHLALIAMSDDVKSNALNPKILRGMPDLLVFHGDEFTDLIDDCELPARRIIQQTTGCDRRAVVESGEPLSPAALLALICAASHTRSSMKFDERIMQWIEGADTSGRELQNCVTVECGVRDPWLRKFQETGHFYL